MKSSQLSQFEAIKAGLGDPDFNPTPAEVVDNCPRCEATLIDPAGLGWCKKCGYCKSLEEDKARAPVQQAAVEKRPTKLGLVEFFQLTARLPRWVWVLFGGVTTIVVFDLPLAQSLPNDSMARAVISTLQVALGILLIFGAQMWALFVLAPDDDKLHFKDAVIPGKLWGLTLKRLPETQGQVWLASWGLVCILSAVTVLGGFGYWLSLLPKASTPAATQQSE